MQYNSIIGQSHPADPTLSGNPSIMLVQHYPTGDLAGYTMHSWNAQIWLPV